MALFTTTSDKLGLYGGVLWSCELQLQGLIVHEMLPLEWGYGRSTSY
jgi:hypothetical protein